MKKYIYLLALIIMVLRAQAQQDISPDSLGGIPFYGINPKGNVILLGNYVMHPQTEHSLGFIGYRLYKLKSKFKKKTLEETYSTLEESRNKYKKITQVFDELTSKPISAPKNLQELAKKAGPYTFQKLLSLYEDNQQDSLWQGILNNDPRLSINASFDLDMAYALGLAYLDSEASQDGVEYYFRMIEKQKGEKIGGVDIHLIDKIPLIPADSLRTRKQKRVGIEPEIKLSFYTKDVGKAHYVCRSMDSLGNYVRLHQEPFYATASYPTMDFTDSTVQDGATYYYTIATVDYWQNEVYSDTLAVIRKPLGALPNGLAVEAVEGGLRLSWDSIKNEYHTGINVYRRIEEDTVFQKANVSLVPPADTSYVDINLLPNRTYVYQITSVNRFGQESNTSAIAKAIFSNKNRPLPPTQVKATGAEDHVLIEWEPSQSVDVVGYQVFRSQGQDTVMVSRKIIAADTTSYQDTTHLHRKGTYVYFVRGLNVAGYEGIFSAPAITQMVDKTPPSRVNSLVGKYHPVRQHNILEWDMPLRPDVVKIRLYRKTAEEDTTAYKMLYEEIVPEGKYKYIDSAIVAGPVYEYILRGVSEQGIESKNSDVLSLLMQLPLLDAPQNVMLGFTEGGIMQIKWLPSTSDPERIDGYKVYRRTYSTEEALLTPEPLGADVYSLEQPDLKPGEVYYYRICAVDKQGEEGEYSEEFRVELSKTE